MESFSGRVAAITGAASGIGRALAVDLAGRGAEVAVSDVDADGLTETVSLVEARGGRVSSQVVDVADRDAVHGWADAVVADHGRVNVIVNNAGVAVAATVEHQPIEDLEWLMGINFWGVVHGTQAFLPHIQAAGDGHVVNLSSVFGLIAIPSQSAYNAAKFAVRGYTDALRMELEIERSPVSASSVHPGGIKTNIARSARMHESVERFGTEAQEARDGFDRVARTTPERAAHVIAEGVLRNRRRILIGPDARVVDLLARLPVGVHHRLLIAGAKLRR